MKGLEGMIRLERMRLDAARKALSEAEASIADIDGRIEALEEGIAREQAIAADSEAGRIYGAYAQASIRRRKSLQMERLEALSVCEARREALQAIFEDLKKFEIIAEREALRARLERERRETAELDETALRRHGAGSS
ncbi:MAG: hypothetical protein Tsb008_03400 [Rhodothalassiaceae bacterium]